MVEEGGGTGGMEGTVRCTDRGTDPGGERVATPRLALTCAEYLGLDGGVHVLGIMTDMTN